MMRTKVSLARMFITGTMLLVLCSCAGRPKLYPPIDDDTGVLRLGEVMYLVTRQEILKSMHYQRLLDSGITDADLRDGSVVILRVYCCGKEFQVDSAPLAYVPQGVDIALGDIIEVRMGEMPGARGKGIVNTVVRVRQHGLANGSCRWVPDTPGLWMRVLYCDWMADEGWIERGGLYKSWLKR